MLSALFWGKHWILAPGCPGQGRAADRVGAIAGVTGYVAPCEQLIPVQPALGDDKDPDADWGRQVQVTRCSASQRERKELLAAGDHPEEDEEDDEGYLTEYLEESGISRSEAKEEASTPADPGSWEGAAKAQVRFVEMSNQLLPGAYSALSPLEVQSLLLRVESWLGELPPLEDALSRDQRDRLEIVAFFHVMIWTGSPVERARQLRIFHGQDTQGLDPEEKLSLLLRTPTGETRSEEAF